MSWNVEVSELVPAFSMGSDRWLVHFCAAGQGIAPIERMLSGGFPPKSKVRKKARKRLLRALRFINFFDDRFSG